jgi:hypothetical protein
MFDDWTVLSTYTVYTVYKKKQFDSYILLKKKEEKKRKKNLLHHSLTRHQSQAYRVALLGPAKALYIFVMHVISTRSKIFDSTLFFSNLS